MNLSFVSLSILHYEVLDRHFPTTPLKNLTQKQSAFGTLSSSE